MFCIVAARDEDDRVSVPESDRCEGRGVEKPNEEGGLLPGRRVAPCPIEPDLTAASASLRAVLDPEKDVARASNAEVDGAAPGGKDASTLLFGSGKDCVESIDLRPDKRRTACAANPPPPDSDPVGVVGESNEKSRAPGGDWSIEDKGLRSACASDSLCSTHIIRSRPVIV